MPLDELIEQLRCGIKDLRRFESELDAYLNLKDCAINDVDVHGRTLLMYAAAYGRSIAIGCLVNRHSLINKKSENEECCTALDYALLRSKLGAVRTLVGSNAIVNVQMLQDHLYDCMVQSKSILYPGDITLFSEAVSRSSMIECGTPSPSFIIKFKKTLESYNKAIEEILETEDEDDTQAIEKGAAVGFCTSFDSQVLAVVASYLYEKKPLIYKFSGSTASSAQDCDPTSQKQSSSVTIRL